MEFETKRALLEYLGKNPEDRKLVDRMIKRWEVYREDWMYHLITNKQRLIDENRELKLKLQKLEWFRSMDDFERKEMNRLIKENLRLEKELKEEKINSEYYQRLYEEEKSDKAYRLRKAFNWISQKVRWVNWDEFNEWVMDDESF